MGTLEGKTALVTGASQSIGLASARALASDGARVVIMGRGTDALQEARDGLLAELPAAKLDLFVGDACDEAALKTALAFAHGLADRLDVIVPTVGGGVMQPILMRDLASVRHEMEVNYLSVFLAIRHGVPLMRAGGSIVCISSVAVTQAFFGLGLYGASKAAMERLVRAAAFELGGAGIRINAVRPGMTVAPDLAESPAFAEMAAQTPLGRVGMPQDIAEVVRFLAGPEAAWITGQAFSVDGGQDQGKIPDMMDATFGKSAMDQIRSGKSLPDDAQMPLLASMSLAPHQA